MKLKKFTSRATLTDGRIYPVYTEVPDQETAKAAKRGLLADKHAVAHWDYRKSKKS